MFLIVLTHSFIWGMPFQAPKSSLMLNNLLYPLFSALSSFSVNCFVLISGYFLSKSYSPKCLKAGKIWFQTFFYSTLFWLVFRYALKRTDTSFFETTLPIINNPYWFVSQYLILLILSPFLARFCDCLDKKSYQYLLLVLFILTGAITSKFPFGVILFGSSHTPTFLFLFMLAGYLSRYELPSCIEDNCGKIFLVIIAIHWIGGLFLNYWYRDTGFIYGAFSSSNSGLPLFSSSALLIWFRKQDWSKSGIARAVASLAPYVFGVYLIHDNLFVRPFIWDKMRVFDYWDSYLFYPHLIAVCAVIFLAGVAIDVVRSVLFRVPGIIKRNTFQR